MGASEGARQAARDKAAAIAANPAEFGRYTRGLVDTSGRPLATTEVQRDFIQGVEWGMAFLMMQGDIVGLCHLEPDDCWVTDVQSTSDPKAPLL